MLIIMALAEMKDDTLKIQQQHFSRNRNWIIHRTHCINLNSAPLYCLKSQNLRYQNTWANKPVKASKKICFLELGWRFKYLPLGPSAAGLFALFLLVHNGKYIVHGPLARKDPNSIIISPEHSKINSSFGQTSSFCWCIPVLTKNPPSFSCYQAFARKVK